MKIWVGQWLLFQEEGVENLVCHLVFACFFVPLASFYFGLMPHDQSHLRKIQLLQLPEIHCTNSCLNTNFHSGLLHEEKKRNSCQADTSTHLFFVHLFAHALSPRRYSLHLGFFKDIEIKFPERKISTQRKESLLRRCMVSVKEKSPKRRLLPTFLHKVKLSKGQQRKKHMTILAQT